MFHLNDFSLRIVTDSPHKEQQKEGLNFLSLPEKAHYSLEIENRRSVEVTVKLLVDGKHLGQWTLPADSVLSVTNEDTSDGHFIFRSGTGLYQGLIQVFFYPRLETSSSCGSCGSCPLSSPVNQSELDERRRLMGYERLSQKEKDNVDLLLALSHSQCKSDQQVPTNNPISNDQINWDQATEISVKLVSFNRTGRMTQTTVPISPVRYIPLISPTPSIPSKKSAFRSTGCSVCGS